MGWISRIGAIALTVSAVALSLGPTAHADDASFLGALDARGLYRSGSPTARLAAGNKFCGELRNGSNPDQIVGRYQSLPGFGLPGTVDDLRGSLRGVIDVAQHELCPDTLG